MVRVLLISSWWKVGAAIFNFLNFVLINLNLPNLTVFFKSFLIVETTAILELLILCITHVDFNPSFFKTIGLFTALVTLRLPKSVYGICLPVLKVSELHSALRRELVRHVLRVSVSPRCRLWHQEGWRN